MLLPSPCTVRLADKSLHMDDTFCEPLSRPFVAMSMIQVEVTDRTSVTVYPRLHYLSSWIPLQVHLAGIG